MEQPELVMKFITLLGAPLNSLKTFFPKQNALKGYPQSGGVSDLFLPCPRERINGDLKRLI